MLTPKVLKLFSSLSGVLVPLFLCVLAFTGAGFAQAATMKSATFEDIRAFFESKQTTVLTFVGYSGAGYVSLFQQNVWERRAGSFRPT